MALAAVVVSMSTSLPGKRTVDVATEPSPTYQQLQILTQASQFTIHMEIMAGTSTVAQAHHHPSSPVFTPWLATQRRLTLGLTCIVTALTCSMLPEVAMVNAKRATCAQQELVMMVPQDLVHQTEQQHSNIALDSIHRGRTTI